MDLPDPGIEPGSSALQADSLPPELQGSPYKLDGLQVNKDARPASCPVAKNDTDQNSPPTMAG